MPAIKLSFSFLSATSTYNSLLKQVLKLHQDGQSIKGIVRLTGLSRNTVRSYLSRFCEDMFITSKQTDAAIADDFIIRMLLPHKSKRYQHLLKHYEGAYSITKKNGRVQSNSTTFEGSVKATNVVKAPFSIGLTQNVKGNTTLDLKTGVEVNVDVGKNKFKDSANASVSF